MDGVCLQALANRGRCGGCRRGCAGGAQNLRQAGPVLGCRFVGQDQGAFLAAARPHKEQADQDAAYNWFGNHHRGILLVMTDSEYLSEAESLLRAVEACCDRINDQSEVDIDNQRVGGMVTLTFANRSQIIINLQKPLHEVWMATKAGGFHYTFQGQWRSTRDQTEFFADLSRHASAQAGQELVFSS